MVIKIIGFDTQAQIEALDNLYQAKINKEREQKELAQQLVNELTNQLNKKNKKIETLTFFVDMLTSTLQITHKEITRLKDLEKA